MCLVLWHCRHPSIYPAPDPLCQRGLLGPPALIARDLLVPRLSLFLKTFPICSCASIVLPPKWLPPPQHVPPAPLDL